MTIWLVSGGMQLSRTARWVRCDSHQDETNSAAAHSGQVAVTGYHRARLAWARDAFMARSLGRHCRPGPWRHISSSVTMCLSRSSPVRSSEAAATVTRPVQPAPALSAPRRGSEYAELSRQVKEAGLLERRPGYYVWKIAVTIGMLAAGWTAFAVVGDSWWQLAVAVFLAVVFTQIGFLGHDAGTGRCSAPGGPAM
jgi:hypothetical protein